MSKNKKYKTDDWQFFVQDIKSKLKQQLEPDQNEVEKFRMKQIQEELVFQQQLQLKKQQDGGSGAATCGNFSTTSTTTALPGRGRSPTESVKSSGSYGTFEGIPGSSGGGDESPRSGAANHHQSPKAMIRSAQSSPNFLKGSINQEDAETSSDQVSSLSALVSRGGGAGARMPSKHPPKVEEDEEMPIVKRVDAAPTS